MKSVLIQNFSGLYFSAFGLNKERYGVSLRIHPECGKIRTRKTPNTNTFHVVNIMEGIRTDLNIYDEAFLQKQLAA